MKKKCDFCEELESYRQIAEVKRHWDEDPELGPYISEYTVAIVIRSWYKNRGKKKAGRTVAFRHRGLGFQLNFCPECGKEINT